MSDVTTVKDWADLASTMRNSRSVSKMIDSVASSSQQGVREQQVDVARDKVQAIIEMEQMDTSSWSTAGQAAHAKALQELDKI